MIGDSERAAVARPCHDACQLPGAILPHVANSGTIIVTVIDLKKIRIGHHARAMMPALCIHAHTSRAKSAEDFISLLYTQLPVIPIPALPAAEPSGVPA